MQAAIAMPVAQTSTVIAMLAPSHFDTFIGRNPASRMMPIVNKTAVPKSVARAGRCCTNTVLASFPTIRWSLAKSLLDQMFQYPLQILQIYQLRVCEKGEFDDRRRKKKSGPSGRYEIPKPVARKWSTHPCQTILPRAGQRLLVSMFVWLVTAWRWSPMDIPAQSPRRWT